MKKKPVIGELKNGIKVTEDYHGTGKIFPVGTKRQAEKKIYHQSKNADGKYVNSKGIVWGEGGTWNYWELPSAEQAAQDYACGWNPLECRTEFDDEYVAAYKELVSKHGRGSYPDEEYRHPLG